MVGMHWIDWTIVLVSVIAIRLVSWSTRKYMNGVADFLSANRSAGRYLLTIAGEMGGLGTISFVAWSQQYMSAGLTNLWWMIMYFPMGLVISLTGWIYYRYRETRALTMPQFFEMRYNKSFRIFTGILNWLCGIVNFGIFPAVAAHFFIYFCGLPPHWHIPGIPVGINTFATVMAIDLALALTFVTQGGQISVMITECVQGMISAVAFLIISATILAKMKWSIIIEALKTAPADASMIHPFHTSGIKDFNVWFYLITMCLGFYGYMAWLGGQGFYSAARSPHEQKMGNIIRDWRGRGVFLVALLMPLAAYTLLHHPAYADMGAQINGVLNGIANDEVRNQAIMPVAMAYFLPVGVKGLLATCMLFCSFTCHDTYMHSWGSIFIQDVYMPMMDRLKQGETRAQRFFSRFLKPVESPEQHIRMLRYSIAFVALFAFTFGMVYPMSDKINFFFSVTGTMVAGAGAVIIGGLYWRKGTTAAAWAAMIVGGVLGLAGVVGYPVYKHFFHKDFPINGIWFSFICTLFTLLLYVIISLIGSRKGHDFNLEKLLHRGQYAIESDRTDIDDTKPPFVEKVFGITKEFSFSDKILAIALVVWNTAWVVVFVVVTIVHFLIHPVSTEWFAKFWHVLVWAWAVTAVPATVWFQIGGVMDVKALFRALATAVRDHTDDGRVISEPDVEPVSEFERESTAVPPKRIGELEQAADTAE